MTNIRRITTHPGEILDKEFLEPHGMSGRKLSIKIDVPPNRITELIRGKRSVTADTALRLGIVFGTTAEFWMNLQTAYDLSKIAIEEADEFKRIKSLGIA